MMIDDEKDTYSIEEVEHLCDKARLEGYRASINDLVDRLSLLGSYFEDIGLTPQRADSWKELLAIIEYDLTHNIGRVD